MNPGEPVDVTADMTRLTLDTIALCGFGYRFNSFYRDTLHPFVEAMYGSIGRKLETRPGTAHPNQVAALASLKKLAENYRYMESEVQQIIDERRRSGNIEDHKDLAQPHVDRGTKDGREAERRQHRGPVPDLPDCWSRNHQRTALFHHQLF